MPNKGKLIVFEGTDGSGKSTQASALCRAMEKNGINCLLTKEPTNTNPMGRMVNEVLSNAVSIEHEALALLFAADRYEHIKKEIIPSLDQGICVVCDRYYMSSFAYQGLFASYETIESYNKIALSILVPDITIFLDTDPKKCIERIGKRMEGRQIFEKFEFITRIRNNYMKAFAKRSGQENVLFVEDEAFERDEISELIWRKVKEIL